MIDYIRNNPLEVAIYAIVLIGTAFAFCVARYELSFKIVIPAGLTLFVVAATLTYLQVRQVLSRA